MASQCDGGPRDADLRQDASDDSAVIASSLDDPEQFAVLFQRHAPRLYRYLACRLGPEVADDIVAEVFLHAFRQRATYHGDPDARPWLYGIATRLVGRHRRAEIRQYRALARTGVDQVADSFTEAVDARVSAACQYRRLAGALAGLPAAYRDALLLVAWGDLTYDETALTLGVPVGTVRSRLSRARARLRRQLEHEPAASAGEQVSGSPRQRRAGL